jgi:lysophospholipase L1-like esterase
MLTRTGRTILRCAVSIALALSGVGGMAQTVWHDATEFTIEGRGWNDAPGPYCRLPERAKGAVPDSVWYLSHHSAGIFARFLTDAPKLSVRWSLTEKNLAMHHMPASGVSGGDLYRREADGTWRYVTTGMAEKQDGNMLEAALGTAKAPREYLLYLPLYNGTAKLEIGAPEGRSIAAAPARTGAVVIYGTSIVQGGCASRPGMAWTAILGRKLDRPVINLGFSGSGRMEPQVSALLAELDPAVFVIDCLWNIGGEKQPVIVSRVKTLIQTIRARHPQTPILFVGQSQIRVEQHPTQASRWQEQAVREMRAQHVPGLYLAPGRKLMGDDAEATVDGCHPNDLGMMRQADALAPIVRRLLR